MDKLFLLTLGGPILGFSIAFGVRLAGYNMPWWGVKTCMVITTLTIWSMFIYTWYEEYKEKKYYLEHHRD